MKDNVSVDGEIDVGFTSYFDPDKHGQTVGGTTEDDLHDEDTVAIPGHIDLDDLSPLQRDIIEAFFSNPSASKSTIEDISGASESWIDMTLGQCDVDPEWEKRAELRGEEIEIRDNSPELDALYHDEEWLRNAYVKADLTQADIEELCDIANATVNNWLKKFNITKPDKDSEYYNPSKREKYKCEEWLEYQIEGKERSVEEIASECGVSSDLIEEAVEKITETEEKCEVEYTEESVDENANQEIDSIGLDMNETQFGHNENELVEETIERQIDTMKEFVEGEEAQTVLNRLETVLEEVR